MRMRPLGYVREAIHILAESFSALCSLPETLQEAEFRGNDLIFFMEDILRKPII